MVTGPRGFGEVQTEGLRAALTDRASAIVTMDCDLSHDPRAVPALLRALEGARLLSAAANGFVRALFGLTARDCTSGFRAYRPEVLETIPWDRRRSPGYSFLVEVLYWPPPPARPALASLDPAC